MNDISNIINEIVDNVCEQYILNETILQIENETREECYICRDEIDSPLIDSPCVCNLKIHERCLINYLDRMGRICSVCRQEFRFPPQLAIVTFQRQLRHCDFYDVMKRAIIFSSIFYIVICLLFFDYIGIETYWLISVCMFIGLCKSDNNRRT